MKASETVAHSSSTGEAEHTSAQSDVGGAPHASARRRRSSARLVPPQAVLRTPQPAVGSHLSPPQAELRARLSPPQAKLRTPRSPPQAELRTPQPAAAELRTPTASPPQAELRMPQHAAGGALCASAHHRRSSARLSRWRFPCRSPPQAALRLQCGPPRGGAFFPRSSPLHEVTLCALAGAPQATLSVPLPAAGDTLVL